MPTYEFWCQKCQKEFEVQRPMSEYKNPSFCPECGTEGKRLISGFGSRAGKFRAVTRPFRESGEKKD